MKRKRLWVMMLAAIAVLLLTPFSIADAPPAAAAVEAATEAKAVEQPAAVEVPAKAVEEPVEVDELVQQTEKVLNDWKTLGWIYGIIGIIGLLMLALRFKPINDFLDKKDWKKYKPYISATLGGLSGFFVAWGEIGSVWPQAVIAGLLGIAGGLAAVGGHQVMTGANSK